MPVFDVSQTEGPDLPDIVSKLNGLAPEGVFEKLTEFADEHWVSRGATIVARERGER